MVKRIWSGIALFAMIGLAAGAARANLIQDGTFSTDSQNFYGVGSTLGGGAWTVTGSALSGSGVDLSQTIWQAPPGGVNSVDLDGFLPGGISQSFATTSGQKYSVSFYLAGNPDGNGPAVKQLEVTAGASTQDFSFDTTSTSDVAMGYLLKSFQFTATSSTSTLAFVSQDPAYVNNGPVVGGIDVLAAVPEPASLAVLLTGGFGLGMVRYRQTKGSPR